MAGIDAVRGRYGVGQSNLEGRMLIVLSGEKIMRQIHGLSRITTRYAHPQISSIYIIIIMVILSAISPESTLPFHIKNCVSMELGKNNRLKALRMMENHT